MDCVESGAPGGVFASLEVTGPAANDDEPLPVGVAAGQGAAAFSLAEEAWRESSQWWLCRTCEEDIGVVTSLVEPVWQAPHRHVGGVSLATGRKRLVCTHCKLRGKLTFVD